MRLPARATSRVRDAGMTMTEMLVVMLIFGIVVAATTTITISMSRTNGQNIARQDLVDEARTAVERISKTTRTAVKPSQLLSNCVSSCADVDAFLQGTPTSMKFYANLDNEGNLVGPSQVTYTIATSGPDAGVLIEKVQVPDPIPPGSTSGYVYCNAEAAGASSACRERLTVRRLAEDVDTSGASVFQYFKGYGDRLTAGATGLSAGDLEKVVGIEINLTVRSASTTAPQPVTYIQHVTLPNAQAVMQQGEDS